MAYAPVKVANEFLRAHAKDGIDPLKLQKLLYYANGWWLASKGEPLLSEKPQVWKNGPVFPSVYRTFSRYKWNYIDGPDTPPFGAAIPSVDGPDRQTVLGFLEWIWAEYGKKTGVELSEDTHQEGTPWRKIAERHEFRVRTNTEIPSSEDWEYFAGMAKQRGYAIAPLTAS